jgi:hypothetical protein
MCASPVRNPKASFTFSLASIQASIASFLVGGIERAPCLKFRAYFSFESRILSSSVIYNTSLLWLVFFFHHSIYHLGDADPVLYAVEPVKLVALVPLLPPFSGDADVLFMELDESPSAACTGTTEGATNAVKIIAVAATSTIPISDLMFDIRANKY